MEWTRSQHTSSFSSRCLASFSFSRESSFCLLSLYSGVGVTPRRGGIATHLELFLVFPGFLLFPLTFKLPLPPFPLRWSQRGAPSEKTWFTTYLESFLAISGPLFFLLAFKFLPSLFLLRSSQNDVQSKLGIITHLELFFQFPGLPLFLFAFEFLTFPFLL